MILIIRAEDGDTRSDCEEAVEKIRGMIEGVIEELHEEVLSTITEYRISVEEEIL